MATITATWTEAVEGRAAATISAGATATIDIDLDNLGADRADAQIGITIGSASSVTVNVFGSPDSGTTDDTTALISYTVTANDRRTIVLDGAFRQISITNNDGSNATGNVSVYYAWRTWVSA